ncbi:helix-turn-helix domain-containing protein [Leuconostoc gasicomitatum]|uniref:Helix-turn-helix transcriptional regulator n=1 Tax=Leuconostoc gasicomitatum TaxID=115778 RepID=A0A9Q3XVJ4_9LACO|nr:helix-turn-helix transcriptional regulator [Leuconostoc gasicomitatum]MBZ5962657.1 helix-turn-helix transcriptional regulator [Leuconostoc gasicomitatum]
MDKELVVKVKRLRGELNISISELSDKSGVSRTTLSDIFNEKRKRMNRKTISKLNDWLLTEEKE